LLNNTYSNSGAVALPRSGIWTNCCCYAI